MPEQVIHARISFEYTDANTPTKPEATRGDFSPVHLAETKEQLDAGLIWSKCSFCNGYVMIKGWPEFGSRIRERCQCGARRISRYVWKGKGDNREAVGYEDGWRKNGEEWTSLE